MWVATASLLLKFISLPSCCTFNCDSPVLNPQFTIVNLLQFSETDLLKISLFDWFIVFGALRLTLRCLILQYYV